eukprot:UN04679
MDDDDIDFPFVQDIKQQQKEQQEHVQETGYEEEAKSDNGVVMEVDLNNTLFSGSKLTKSSYVDNYQKSLRHEVFTYDHIDDLNPLKNEEVKKLKNEIKTKYAMDEIVNDEHLSKYAKRKLKKYKKLGELIERSRDSDLCIVTMPFPRAEYTSYEYMKILQSLTPKNMNNLIFVRGNQDQVLTFAL